MNALLTKRGILVIACLIAILYNVAAFWNTHSPAIPSPENETALPIELAEAIRVDDGIKLKPGLSINESGAYQGYTLISPIICSQTWLIDMNGRVVHQWNHDSRPSLGAELLENGHLLRCAQLKLEIDRRSRTFETPGKIQEFDWDGELLWDFELPAGNLVQHHDCIKLPNGNVMVVARERMATQEANRFGWKGAFPENTPYFPADCILEIKQTGKTSGEIVWRWNVLDHILQDVDPTKPNFVNPREAAAHPELVDLNYRPQNHKTPAVRALESDALKSIGYLDAGRTWRSAPASTRNPDFTHFNSVAYNAHLDQVMIGVREFSEMWIIDHSCTTEQAAGHVGGCRGKGGDLLYRWGNPAAYRCGTPADQILFFQHNAHWIPDGLPGAGHMLMFNNGENRPGGSFSTIEEVAIPSEGAGGYSLARRSSFGPSKPLWTFAAEKKEDFYSVQLSGAQRLPNGNTLICSGMHGVVFEATPEGRVVWKYVNPVDSASPIENVSKVVAGDKNSTLNGPEREMRSSLFRAYRYGFDFPAFGGRKLQSGMPLQDWNLQSR